MKKAGYDREGEGEKLVNTPKDFSQCSNKPQLKTKVLCQLSSKTISGHSLSAFGFCHYVDLTSHFLSHCAFKENHRYCQRKGIWLSILTSKSFAACNGKASVEQHLDTLFLAAVTKMKMPGERMP